jgi:hypothetical protein
MQPRLHLEHCHASVHVDNEARAELLGVTSMQICHMSKSQNIEMNGAQAIDLEANKGTTLKILQRTCLAAPYRTLRRQKL